MALKFPISGDLFVCYYVMLTCWQNCRKINLNSNTFWSILFFFYSILLLLIFISYPLIVYRATIREGFHPPSLTIEASFLPVICALAFEPLAALHKMIEDIVHLQLYLDTFKVYWPEAFLQNFPVHCPARRTPPIMRVPLEMLTPRIFILHTKFLLSSIEEANCELYLQSYHVDSHLTT